jgi:hypothetical protein
MTLRLGAIALVALLASCASPQEVITERENLLAASGFAVLPANTAERQQMLATLPPGRIMQQIQGDQVSYLFADPLVCHCLYAGGQQNFAQYQAYVQTRRIADEQAVAAQLYWNGPWNWGPWGGYGYWR